MATISADDPLTAQLAGPSTTALEALLAERPEIVSVRVVDGRGCERDALHLLLDWPGGKPRTPETIRALVAAGADPNSPLDGGSALSNPVAFGLWESARRLVERGAVVGLWQAAALGDLDRVRALATGASDQDLRNALLVRGPWRPAGHGPLPARAGRRPEVGGPRRSHRRRRRPPPRGHRPGRPARRRGCRRRRLTAWAQRV